MGFVAILLWGTLWAEITRVDLGEKLFLEDRFSASFFMQSHDPNDLETVGDPELWDLEVFDQTYPHPQRGQHFSCASCHFVDQLSVLQESWVLTYNDFSARSRVPYRTDGNTRTLRNSMNMVMSSKNEGSPLHWDGEFFSAKDLACSTLVGRNMGWRIGEEKTARAHVVSVLRNDKGEYPTPSDFKDSYVTLFAELGMKISALSDQELFNESCQLLADYMADLDYSRDEDGEFNGSAYDQFLKLNGVRAYLSDGESHKDYLQYLQLSLKAKKQWKWLETKDLKYHQTPAVFGPSELKGLQVFLGEGQCVRCHTPPDFTDSSFHNNGVSQFEYDRIHGVGSFARLKVPQKLLNPQWDQLYLFPTENHPDGEGVYRQTPSKKDPRLVDLGVWNILVHPDRSKVHQPLRERICQSLDLDCAQVSQDFLISKSIARFKTPTLRSLGQSAPYFHNGMAKELMDVLAIYRASMIKAQQGKLINVDPVFLDMKLSPGDFRDLEAFLKSLNEDYD